MTWKEVRDRSVKLASGLTAQFGVGRGDVVQVMLANTPHMFEAHYGVPMSGATLGSVNTRLNAKEVAYVLRHSESKVLIVDTEFSSVAKGALEILKAEGVATPRVIEACDHHGRGDAANENRLDSDAIEGEYEDLLARGSVDFAWVRPEHEFDAIGLNYTSGTTGQPKGVVLHHRGAYLTALGNTLTFGGMPAESTRYLWTLPMFHCNGWNFPYTLAAIGGTSVCLREVDGASIGNAIVEHAVTHLCGAPIIVDRMIDFAASEGTTYDPPVKMMVAAAPPPESTLKKAADAGIALTHVYGLTETYGPATTCEWRTKWSDESPEKQAVLRSRQGVKYPTGDGATVLDPETMEEVPRDGKTLGEIMFRGNMVMKGYYKNPEATAEAFENGWFHSGDLGVLHPDGYMQIKDRSKDIVISGGENISSIEVENVLCKHPGLSGAAVVARPSKQWGETPCAFVTVDQAAVREGVEVPTEAEVIAFAKTDLAFKAPKTVVFLEELPYNNNGKVQKVVLREQAKAMGDHV